MTARDRLDNLHRCLEALAAASGWLGRSFGQCRDIGGARPYSAEQFDAFETLTSRFARTVDILIHKVYRAVDAMEMEDGGTMLDVVNRAHKRGLLDSVERLRDMKDIRNEIAHEYSQDSLEDLFADVMSLTPELLALTNKARTYCEKFHPEGNRP
jgi:uncharacterized protein YutE (UPF0331/DUF86 family)